MHLPVVPRIICQAETHAKEIFQCYAASTSFLLKPFRDPMNEYATVPSTLVARLLSIWWKCPFALSKMPSYIPWQNALIQNALFLKGHFE